MAFPDDNEPPRRTSNVRRVSNSTTALAVGGAIIALLIGLSWFYSGRSAPTTDTPNTPAQSEPQR
jgi:hypothetical protein